MSSFNLLSLGSQAVKTNQSALGVVSQNISNVNTEGYSRQVVHFNSTVPSGVEVASIERVTNDFLNRQFWSDNSTYEASNVYANLALEVDNLLGQEVTSITTAMDSYFATMQNAVDNPTSMAHRELLLEQSDTLSRRFNDLYSNVNQQHERVNSLLDDAVSDINSYAASIADINEQIRLSNANGGNINELLDHRDKAIAELSKLTDIQVFDGDDGMLNVSMANGQPLVTGLSSNKLYTFNNTMDGTQKEIGIEISGVKSPVSDRIVGGMVGGLFDYRDEILNPTLNEMGRIAIAFSESMNEVQQSGMNLNNDIGGRLFNDVNSYQAMSKRITGSTDNVGKYGTSTVEITDLSKLTGDEYLMEFGNNNTLTITNQTSGEKTTLSDLQQVVSAADVSDGTYFLDTATREIVLEMDGVKIRLDAVTPFVPGDQFLVQPTRDGALNIKTEMTDPRHLALASPVRANTDPNNTGTGEISVRVTDINTNAFTTTPGAIKPPVEIVFSGSGSSLTYTVYDVTDPANPAVFDAGYGPLKDKAYVAGQGIELGGYEATIISEPKAGDTFSFEYNTDGFSDNRNALLMSNLQQAALLDSGSLQDSYSGLLETVAGKTAKANILVDSNKAVLSATVEARSSLSGVNLDEEAARLVQFQQAYQASAQIISVSQELFDTLLAL